MLVLKIMLSQTEQYDIINIMNMRTLNEIDERGKVVKILTACLQECFQCSCQSFPRYNSN